MGQQSHAHAVLTIRGSELDPDAVTTVLGVTPTRASKRGDGKVGKPSPRIGFWTLDVRVNDLDQLDQAVRTVIENASRAAAEWDAITRDFDVDLTLVLYLYRANEGAGLQGSTIEMLAAKGIGLDFDLYSLAQA